MNFWIKYSFIFLGLSLLTSCGGDDDICLSGEATPRLKIKFKTDSNDKLKTMDSLRISVDYGNGQLKEMVKNRSVDSVLIPMRVDNTNFTDIYVQETFKGPISKIRINYTTESIYVSPACGYKKTYHNVNSELLEKNPVLNIENNQNDIIDENKTSLYLKF